MEFSEITAMIMTVVVSGAVQSIITVSVVKNDISWLKKGLTRAHERVDKINEVLTHVSR